MAELAILILNVEIALMLLLMIIQVRKVYILTSDIT